VNSKMLLVLLLCSTLSLSLAACVQTVYSESANSTSYSIVKITNPTCATYSSRFLTLDVTFTYGGLNYNLTYTLDGQNRGAIPYSVYNPNNEFHITYAAFGSVDLPELSDGSHSITVTLVVGVHYAGGGKPGAPFQPTSPGSSDYQATWSDTVSFTVYSDEPYTPQPQQPAPVVDSTPPKISDLSVENQTYLSGDVALNFTVNENSSRIAYSLDGEGNVTIAGNVTLNGLAVGVHNVTVYSWDESGNVGASKTVNFSVAAFVSAAPESPENFLTALIVAAPLVATATFAAGLIVYSKRRKADQPS